ncbi:hypothetical protein [Halobacillus litoralis]|uniref:hypothetical protein n=1 Tax=Halobacillus litoralis TaxID=45668 RepID=UPI001CFD2DFB|nr:hypothetical protein [Halobacillus litoralis]
MKKKEHLDKAVRYFKRRPLENVLRASWIKYQQLEHTGGTIMTEKLSYKELLALAEFMGMSEHALDLKRKFSLARMERQIIAYWPGVTMKDLLEAYFNQPILPLNESDSNNLS